MINLAVLAYQSIYHLRDKRFVIVRAFAAVALVARMLQMINGVNQNDIGMAVATWPFLVCGVAVMTRYIQNTVDLCYVLGA